MDRHIVLEGFPRIGFHKVVESPLRSVDDCFFQSVFDDCPDRARIIQGDAGPHDSEAELPGEARLALFHHVDSAHEQVFGSKVDFRNMRNPKVFLLAREDHGVEHFLVSHL